MFARNIINHADSIARLLALLGNGKRLAIIGHLMDAELPVGAIADRVGLSQSALSQHLAKLRSSGMVSTRRDRQMIYYTCNSHEIRALFETLESMLPLDGFFDDDTDEA